jgi:hypothetical protein
MSDSQDDPQHHSDFSLFGNFPPEIQHIILDFRCLLQMQERYGTGDYEALAKRFGVEGRVGSCRL